MSHVALQIRYALLSNTYFDKDEKSKGLSLHHDSRPANKICIALIARDPKKKRNPSGAHLTVTFDSTTEAVI